jgi:hypothetical protein
MTEAIFIIAGFSCPIYIPTTPQSLLWVVPLTASLAIVYKATKLPKITPVNFIKETAALIGSILVFLAVTAVILYAVAWFITE